MYTLCIFKQAPAECQHSHLALISSHHTLADPAARLLPEVNRILVASPSWIHGSCHAMRMQLQERMAECGWLRAFASRVASKQSMCSGMFHINRSLSPCLFCVHHTDTVKRLPWIGGKGSAS
jgi:hypothetical protein